MGEVSDADIVNIANGFLLNSPPGEFMEVVTDVRALLPDDTLLNDTAPATFREYNTEQMITTRSPAHQHDIIICKQAEVGEGEFIDHRGNQIVFFDHIRQQTTGRRALQQEVDHEVESYRAALDDAAQQYAAEHYPSGVAAAYSARSDSGSYQVHVCFVNTKFQPSNWVNGRWRSVWTVTFNPGQPAEITGLVRIVVHYYEAGNVQLSTNYEKKLSCGQTNDANKLAAEVIKTITKAEADYQTALGHSFDTMSQNTFKALRRVLPITKDRINWDKINTMKLASDVGKAGVGRK
jgi:capping protein alpha